MIVNSKAMAGVPVVTRGGQSLGKVASFDLDPSTGHLTAVRVHARGLVTGLLRDELIVSWDAVLEMSRERVVVTDAVVKTSVIAAQTKTAPSPTLLKEG